MTHLYCPAVKSLAVVLIAIALVALAPLAALAPQAVAAESDVAQSADAQSAPAEPGVIRTIVLDPGHGGEEVGAVGKSGVLEKDLAIDIARRLQDRLTRNLNLNVILTREDDRVVPLRERTAIANHAKADLFLSIHLNSSRRASAHGTETYFLALTASDEEAMSLARSENLTEPEPVPGPVPGPVDPNAPANPNSAAPPASGPSGAAELDLVLWEMAQSEHIVRSSRLAEVIQDEMNRLLGVGSRGIKQAPFTVLMGATMPSVLVEVAFLSNENEEKELTNPEFRDKVAQAIEYAIARFKSESERALSEAPPPAGGPQR